MAELASNRKAHFDYEILQKYEAGLELLGHEVKSIRAGHAQLAGSFVVIRGGEAFLVGATIPPYQVKNMPESYDPTRTRRLLLKRSELNELIGESAQKGLTFVPISLYTKGSLIKLSFGQARRKKKYDKRETIKKREDKRNINRALRQH